MRDLVVGQPHVSTETYVRRHSIVAIIRDGRGQIGKLSQIRADERMRGGLSAKVEERLENVGMVRKRPEHVEVPTRPLAQAK